MWQSKPLAVTLFIGLTLLGAAISQGSKPPPLKAAKYTVSDSVINFSNQGQKIVANWAIPKGATAPYPAVVILHGFTGQRQELGVSGTTETLFSRTARLLAEQGYASLRIDFRGSGESIGTFTFADTTFSSQISDARAAIDFLSRQPQVDHKRIAILGLSQGGLVGATVAAADSQVKSLILWSPVAVPSQTFGDLLGREAITKGLASKGKAISVTVPWGLSVELKTKFFEDLFRINPIAEITRYNRPLLVVVGLKDQVVTPQPQAGQLYLEYHPGREKLVILDADHIFDAQSGPKHLDEGIAWSINWLEQTL